MKAKKFYKTMSHEEIVASGGTEEDAEFIHLKAKQKFKGSGHIMFGALCGCCGFTKDGNIYTVQSSLGTARSYVALASCEHKNAFMLCTGCWEKYVERVEEGVGMLSSEYPCTCLTDFMDKVCS